MAMAVGDGFGGITANINMTPMIDILLVLLIIFMAISPTEPLGLEALAPQPPPLNAPPHPGDRTVVIQIDNDHKWKIDAEEILEDKVEDRLIGIFKTRAERVVFVKGDPDLEFEWVARAIDHAHGAISIKSA